MDPYQPLISVLIPSYNHEKYIAECIESIWSQPYKNIEIVVVDDCSTDASPGILSDLQRQSPLPMQLHRNERNSGVSATLNVALGKAQGELVAVLGSDDKFAPDRFSAQLVQFQRIPALKVAFANCPKLRNGKLRNTTKSADESQILESLDRNLILNYLYTVGIPFLLQSALIRASFLREVGGWDEGMLSDDQVLMTKIFENIHENQECSYVSNSVAYHRVHDANASKNLDRHTRLRLQYVEKYTPNKLKSKAYSNTYFYMARKYLRSGIKKKAWNHYMRSQRYLFRFEHLFFIRKFLSRLIFSR